MQDNTVAVWDIAVRIFHWSLVALFVFSYFSGDVEALEDIHPYSGYLIILLIIFRVIWGFVGSKHARFSDFLYPPSKVIEYLKSLRSGEPVHYLGHNPAGGWMIVALLISLSITCASGLTYLTSEGEGPFAQAPSIELINTAYADDDEHEEHGHDKHEEEGDEFWEEVHELFGNLTLLLVLAHIAGVIVSSRAHKENLARAMVTGRKRAE